MLTKPMLAGAKAGKLHNCPVTAGGLTTAPQLTVSCNRICQVWRDMHQLVAVTDDRCSLSCGCVVQYHCFIRWAPACDKL